MQQLYLLVGQRGARYGVSIYTLRRAGQPIRSERATHVASLLSLLAEGHLLLDERGAAQEEIAASARLARFVPLPAASGGPDTYRVSLVHHSGRVSVVAGGVAQAYAGQVPDGFAGAAAAVALVPGVLLLVPGSIGYRSLTSLLDQNVIVGVTAGFTMILTAVAIAAGFLVSSVLVPTRNNSKFKIQNEARGGPGQS